MTELAARIERGADPIARLSAVTELRSLLAAAEAAAVRDARTGRVPWATIGASLGVSKQAAQKRHADVRLVGEDTEVAGSDRHPTVDRPVIERRRRRPLGWEITTPRGRTLLRVQPSLRADHKAGRGSAW